MPIDFASQINLQQSGVSQLVGSQILMPNTPSFSAWGSPGAVGAPSNFAYPTEIYDLGGNNYNPSNGRYTAPVGGVYYFFGYFLCDNTTSGEHRQSIMLNGTAVVGGTYIAIKTTGYWTMFCGAYVQMAAGDYVAVYRIQGGATWNDVNYCAFGGYLIT